MHHLNWRGCGKLRLTILQRYFLRELAGPFLLGLGVFTFVFLVGQLYKLLDLLTKNGASPLLVGELILSMLPWILSLTTPMALLVAILLSVGRLTADREVLAIRMSGVNLMHVFAPVLGVAGLLSLLLIGANQALIPSLYLRAMDLAIQIQFNVLSNISPNEPQELETSEKGQSSVFFFERRDPKTGLMEHINIKTSIEEKPSEELVALERQLKEKTKQAMQTKDPQIRREAMKLKLEVERLQRSKMVRESLITANHGKLEADLEARLITLELVNGSIHYVDVEEPTKYNVIRFQKLTKGVRPRLTRTTDTGSYRKSPREMSVSELRREMRESTKPYLFSTELYQRFSVPLACLAFALVALPLAVFVRPTAKAIAFGLSLFLIFVYYGLLQYGISLGNTGSPAAAFGIFLPNIMLALIGSLLLYRTVMK